jgi:hypothetical protein
MIQLSIFSIGEISPKCKGKNSKFKKLRDFGGFQSLEVRAKKV